MLKACVLLLVVVACHHSVSADANGDLPLWPLPRQVTFPTERNEVKVLGPDWKCDIVIPGSPSEILKEACDRYHGYINAVSAAQVFRDKDVVQILQLNVKEAEQDTELNMNTNESYSIHVDKTNVVKIFADNVFGALRALETFSQVVSGNMTLPELAIKDRPRFQHRELLVDTARYYLNTSFLEHIVDAMSFSKFNVLHWHVIDSQSFSIQSKKYPLLSEKGQFKDNSHFCPYSSCVYSAEDIRGLVSYARARGVRVLLEVDTPGHSKSWGAAYKNMTVNLCTLNADNVPLDPTIQFTLEVVTGFLSEMLNGSNPLFPDEFVHLGGDEVDLSCWQKDKSIEKYMEENHLTPETLLSKWLEEVREQVDKVKPNVLYWEDVFNYSSSVRNNNTIFEVWRDKSTLHKIASSGSRCVLSAGWYIHAQSKWTDFYDNEPFDAEEDWTATEKSLVEGGAVSYWGCSGFCPFPYTADKFDPRTWPVAAAAAERLWSTESVTDHGQALPRLTAHTKRLISRGVHASKLK
jgi:hexosaminidase